MSVLPIYQVICDGCSNIDYLDGQNKKELKTELEARGWVVKGNCSQVYCAETCAELVS